MTYDDLLEKLARTVHERYNIDTQVFDTEKDSNTFKTRITLKETGALIYECLSPNVVGVKSFERSRELHFETVILQLMRKGLYK